MQEMFFSELKPFVRYSRYMSADVSLFSFTICAYDARLMLCVEGEGKVYLQGTPYDIHQGVLLLWRPGIAYSYQQSEENPMRFYGLNFDFTDNYSHITTPIPPESENIFDSKKIINDGYFSDETALNKPIVMENMQNLTERFIEINTEYNQKKIYYKERCSGLLMNLLASIAMYTGVSELPAKSTITVNSIINFLSENYNTEISNEQIGKMFNYHPIYINRLFIMHTGVSLHQYLQNLRITKAINMLKDTNLPISEICFKTGFKSLSHFSKYFKAKIGYSPSYFRSK